jgi:hypothetical protein
MRSDLDLFYLVFKEHFFSSPWEKLVVCLCWEELVFISTGAEGPNGKQQGRALAGLGTPMAFLRSVSRGAVPQPPRILAGPGIALPGFQPEAASCGKSWDHPQRGTGQAKSFQY